MVGVQTFILIIALRNSFLILIQTKRCKCVEIIILIPTDVVFFFNFFFLFFGCLFCLWGFALKLSKICDLAVDVHLLNCLYFVYRKK